MSLSAIPHSQKNRDFGIIYEVSNQQGVKSYLIGTCHVVDQESVQDPAIREIIQKCSALYSEIGNNFFINSAHGSMPEGDHQYQHIPLRYTYDIAIMLAAWCKKIPIISLDVGIPDRDQDIARDRKILREQGVDESERLCMQRCEMFSCDPQSFKVLKEWKNGNIEYFIRSRNEDSDGSFDTVITQREEHWVKTLIPKLLETEQPIVIAAGANHVVGDNSLPERFAKAGLKVELISSVLPTLEAKLPALIHQKVHSTKTIPRSRL